MTVKIGGVDYIVVSEVIVDDDRICVCLKRPTGNVLYVSNRSKNGVYSPVVSTGSTVSYK